MPSSVTTSDIPAGDPPLILQEPCAAYEGSLQRRWNEIPLKTRFYDTQKHEIVVLSRGTWNMESGPDFKNARIQIGGTLLKGDVEIHVNRSDWDRHKHSDDPAYANVILHVVEKNDSNTRNDLPTLLIPSGKRIEMAPPPLKTPYGECAVLFSKMDAERTVQFFQDAGWERLQEKAHILLESMIRDGTGTAFLRKLFDQLGSKRNRNAMNSVFTAVVQKYPADVFLTNYEVILWGESGLIPADDTVIPDPVSAAKMHEIWQKWWGLRPDSAERPPWTRDGTRPLNSPEREMAALIALLNKNGADPVPQLAEDCKKAPNAETFVKKLVGSLMAEDPFWDNRTSFTAPLLKNPAHIIGESRARILAVDVAIPSLMAYACLKKDCVLRDRLKLAAVKLPRTAENRITRDAFTKWFADPAFAGKILTDACARQGVLHIYKRFCESAGGNCAVCLIRNSFSA